jgi:hypothetical protein
MSSTAFNLEEYNLAYPDGVENNYWTITRLHVLYKTLSAYSDVKNIIEIGCGKGIVVNNLRLRGLTIEGCELADVPSIDAVKQFVHPGTDANKMPEDFRKKFDTMLLLDVIEHIENEKEFLTNLLVNYPNVKRVVITVPSRQEIWSNYDEFYGHFRRYSIKSLKDVLHSCNLQTNSIHYFFHSLYLPGLLQKKLNIKREIKIASPKGISIAIHKLLALFFKLDANVVPGSVYGTSIIAVAERKR